MVSAARSNWQARATALLALLSAVALAQAADDFEPASLDLPKMISCKMSAREYNQFAMWFAVEPDAPGSAMQWAQSKPVPASATT